MKAPLSANQSVNQNHLFSKTADRIFIKFLVNFCFLKDKKVIQAGQNLIFGKKPEISLKVELFGVGKKFVPLMYYFQVYMMHHSCLYDVIVFSYLQKLYVLGISLSQDINENAFDQSVCKNF